MGQSLEGEDGTDTGASSWRINSTLAAYLILKL